MRKTLTILLTAIFLTLLAGAQEKEKRGPSTPDERKRFVDLTGKLIKSPLDESLKDEAKWALQWLSDVPDVNVNPCPLPLGDMVPSDYKHAARIFSIYVLAMGVYAIEHPKKSEDETPQYLAGVEAALSAYKSILKSKPGANSEDLDNLLAKQQSGKLEAFVKTAGQECSQ
ncbi:MAG TPA: hypothetical protein VNW97_17170 [Candidatus Saccharimonadales bacterium]|jgi:hypothetical protein|nr:hypothetical protein [Candidatus Saccharimonadales bacterium]